MLVVFVAAVKLAHNVGKVVCLGGGCVLCVCVCVFWCFGGGGGEGFWLCIAHFRTIVKYVAYCNLHRTKG